jgi:alginate O-acetyltransferase complex protein AlgJ
MRTLSREEQARAEVGHTDVGRRTAAVLVVVFLAGVAAVAVFDALAPRASAPAEPSGAAFARLSGALPAVERAFAAGGAPAADRELLARIDSLEDDIEHGSTFAAAVGPPLRWLQTAVLGGAREQVDRGRDGWLFLADGDRSLTGPPFLAPRPRVRLRRGGASREEPRDGDPAAAIEDFAHQLAARGIALLVVPAPTKAAIHPELLSPAVPAAAAPLVNPSWAALRARLEAAGIAVFDPAPILAQAARESGAPQYLEGDSHWRPEAVERVAAALAPEIERLAPGELSASAAYRTEAGSAEGEGDLVHLLGLPGWQRRYPPQQVELRQVVAARDGRPWAPERRSDVLLLGDSFTNVYSQAGLGWGRGAGLAEQLSLRLGRPLDRIAVNAGGAHASRERLAQALAAGEDRLAGKRLVVYEFAARELAVGDWRRVELRRR